MSRGRHKQKKELWVSDTRSGLVKDCEFYFAFMSLLKIRKQIFTFTGVIPSLSIPSLPSTVPNFTGRRSECEEITGYVTSESTRLVSIWG